MNNYTFTVAKIVKKDLDRQGLYLTGIVLKYEEDAKDGIVNRDIE